MKGGTEGGAVQICAKCKKDKGKNKSSDLHQK